MCRSAPTDEPACSSSIAIVTVLPFVAALAYFPIRTPALKLFVAKSASTADVGSVGESSAITTTPAFLAFAIAAFSALRVGDGDEDPLDARRHHVLDRRDLTGVVGAVLAGGVDQLGAELLCLGRRSRLHLHEERVRDVLRDQPDLDRRRSASRCRPSRPRRCSRPPTTATRAITRPSESRLRRDWRSSLRMTHHVPPFRLHLSRAW